MLIHWRPSAAWGNSGRPTLECSGVGGCGEKVSGYTEDGGRGRSQTSTLLAGDRRGGGMTGESWRLRRRYEDEMQHCFNLANRCQMSQWFRPLWQSLPVKHDTFVVVRPIFFFSFFFKTWGRCVSGPPWISKHLRTGSRGQHNLLTKPQVAQQVAQRWWVYQRFSVM